MLSLVIWWAPRKSRISCGQGEKITLYNLRFSPEIALSTYNAVWHNVLHQLKVTVPQAEEQTVLYAEEIHTALVRTIRVITHLAMVLHPIDLPNPRQEDPLVAVAHAGLLHPQPLYIRRLRYEHCLRFANQSRSKVINRRSTTFSCATHGMTGAAPQKISMML